jgi:hypothetical protein
MADWGSVQDEWSAAAGVDDDDWVWSLLFLMGEWKGEWRGMEGRLGSLIFPFPFTIRLG